VCSVEETRTLILPELVELMNDEHCHVRLAGLDTVVNILPLLDYGTTDLPVKYSILPRSSVAGASRIQYYLLYAQ